MEKLIFQNQGQICRTSDGLMVIQKQLSQYSVSLKRQKFYMGNCGQTKYFDQITHKFEAEDIDNDLQSQEQISDQIRTFLQKQFNNKERISFVKQLNQSTTVSSINLSAERYQNKITIPFAEIKTDLIIENSVNRKQKNRQNKQNYKSWCDEQIQNIEQQFTRNGTINIDQIAREQMLSYSSNNTLFMEEFKNEETVIKHECIKNYYKFGQWIGEGTFGNVYKGIQIKNQRQVAIKIIKKKYIPHKSKIIEMPQISLLKKLKHQNIINLYDIFYWDENIYLVSELCNGRQLSKFIKQSQNREMTVRSIMRQLLEAVRYLHEQQIVHRDLKFQNIVMTKFQIGKIKIIDFGCAKQLKLARERDQKALGTINYMSPQQLKGFYSRKCDIWSCGVIMYEMLTGINPFKGINQNESIYRINTRHFSQHDTSLKNISEFAKDLLKQMLTHNEFKRINANQALNHEWFKPWIFSEREQKRSKHMRMSYNLVLLNSLSHKNRLNQHNQENQMNRKKNKMASILEYYLHFKQSFNKNINQIKIQIKLIKQANKKSMPISAFSSQIIQKCNLYTRNQVIQNFINFTNSFFRGKAGKANIDQFILKLDQWKDETIRNMLKNQLHLYLKDEQANLSTQFLKKCSQLHNKNLKDSVVLDGFTEESFKQSFHEESFKKVKQSLPAESQIGCSFKEIEQILQNVITQNIEEVVFSYILKSF